MRIRNLKDLLLVTTAITAGAFTAQAAEQPQSTAAQQAAAELEEVIVTGSRLRVSGFETPTPVTTLSAEALESRAATTIADVVNQLPAMRQSVTNTQTQRGNGNGGRNGVDLRGLGTARTLVLVNGRRVLGTDDLNQIPTALVERVEVVTGGASAAYGSDAVSGVVNFILKDSMNGIQGSAQYKVSQYGDSKEPAFSLAGGTPFANGRGQLILGGDYSDSKGMGTIYSRDWYKDQVGLVAFPATNRGTNPAQALLPNVTYSTQTAGGIVLSGPLKGTAFGPGGTPFQMQYGTIFSTLQAGGENYGASPFGNWWVEAPHKRYTALGKVSYDVTDDINVFFEYEFGHNEQDGLSTFHQNTGLIIPNTNPFIPAATRAQMTALGLTQITIGRMETTLGGYQLRNGETTNQQTAGVEGDIFEGAWSWDAWVSHGYRKTHAKVISNIMEGNYLASTYVVTGANGQPACGPLATNPNMTAARAAQVTQNCVPFNVFGPKDASAQAIEYIRYTSNTETQQRQWAMAANISGEPFQLPGGPFATAFGIEHRSNNNQGQADSISHAFGGTASLSNNGTDTPLQKLSVTEGYLEAGAPLASNATWAESFDLNGAIRLTDYSTSGRVTTWKLGASYAPVNDIRFRITRSRDIRAPTLANLFATPNTGITASFLNPVTGLTGPLYTRGGGNPSLKPEIANSWVGGAVLTPSMVEGLSVSVDYFNIKINGVIAAVSAQNIASRCAQGLQEYCALMGIEPLTGGLLIRTVPANLQALKTSGLDFELSYSLPGDVIGLPGDFRIRALNTYVHELTTTEASVAIDRAGSGAGGGLPRWSGNFNLSHTWERLTTNITARYFSGILADATLVEPRQSGYNSALPNSINYNVYPAAVYVDLSEQYNIIDNDDLRVQAYVNVSNLFNRAPPYAALIAFIVGGNPYDMIGRTFRMGMRFTY